MRRAAMVACSITALAAPVAFSGLAGAQDTGSDSRFPDQSHFQKVTLNDRPGEPMSLAVLPNGRVLHSARTGEIRLYNPRTGTNNIITDMKQSPQGLYQHDEEGVQGIADRPRLHRQPLGLRLLLAEAEHAVGRDRHRHQRRRRSGKPHDRR